MAEGLSAGAAQPEEDEEFELRTWSIADAWGLSRSGPLTRREDAGGPGLGAHPKRMILAAENVVDLQFFLLDAARQYGRTRGLEVVTGDLLASAAALDYALLLSSQAADEPIEDASPMGLTLRETMTRARPTSPSNFVEAILRASDSVFDDFVERHIRVGGLFDVIKGVARPGGRGRRRPSPFAA